MDMVLEGAEFGVGGAGGLSSGCAYVYEGMSEYVRVCECMPAWMHVHLCEHACMFVCACQCL